MTESDREHGPRSTDDSTPLPMRVAELGVASSVLPAVPTAESVLLTIAAAEGPWFPARYAAEAGISRDSLDEPLAELRLAGFVRVAEWVRGVGQGYTLTPEGTAAAADPAARKQLTAAPAEKGLEELSGPEDPIDLAPTPDPAHQSELVLSPPVVVPALLMANALWFFVCAVVSIRWGLTPSRALSEGHPEVLHRFGAVSGTDLLAGEWWRLLTSCFVHIGALHLIGNMFALAMMGPLAELLWGRGRLLVIYLVSGVAGSALAMILRPDSILAGASGAIWGIQMSLFAWLFTFRKHLPPDLASDWLRRLWVVFLLNAGLSLLPNVSWEGHLGGGAAGFMVAGLLTAARFGDRPRRITAWALIAVLPLVCVAALAAAMDAKGIPAWQHLRERIDRQADQRAAAERRQLLRAAHAEFNRDVVPHLEKLDPDESKKLEADAALLLSLPGRAPQRVAPVRKQLEELRTVAAGLCARAPDEPTGVEVFDRHRARARAFAESRLKTFQSLLELLDAPGVPASARWQALEAERAEAGRLWAELHAN